MIKVKKDLTGLTFGRLTVLKQVEDYVSPSGRRESKWLCKCSCGNEKLSQVRTSQLTGGHTQSCGCLKIERTIERNRILMKKYNIYDLSGEYGIGYTAKNEEFYFDLEDHEKIKDIYWHINPQGYVMGKRIDNSDVNVFMHRIIMNVDNISHTEIMIDHIHGKETRNDNRKSNLRFATNSQNCINICLKSNNSSGCTGVTWNKRSNKWHARITYNKQEIHLGFYTNFEDAVNARKKAEEKYFGEWSYDYSQTI